MTRELLMSRIGRSAGTVLGAIALLLALLTIWQAGSNRGLQQRFADNQANLAKAQQLANLDNSLVQLIAKSAVDNKDDALRDLLSSNGVTLNPSAAPEAAPSGDGKAE